MDENSVKANGSESNQEQPEQQAPSTQEAGGAVAPRAESKPEEFEKQLAQMKDLLLRKAAEFENYKRRAESEGVTLIKFANEDLIAEILPVLDDLERSLKLSKDRKDFESFFRGVELIYQKLFKILESRGVKTFETVGKEFSVHYHDALLQIPNENVPPHTVIEEIEKGYTLNEKVIRHAKVIVSASPAQPEATGQSLVEQPAPKSEKG